VKIEFRNGNVVESLPFSGNTKRSKSKEIKLAINTTIQLKWYQKIFARLFTKH
jgi:hypothetical protein